MPAEHAGKVAEDIQAAVTFEGVVDGGLDVGLECDVAMDEGSKWEEGVSKELSSLVVDVSDHYFGAVADEEADRGFADASGTACD